MTVTVSGVTYAYYANVSTISQLNSAISAADAAVSGTGGYLITLGGNIYATNYANPLLAFNLPTNVSVTVNGGSNDYSINGVASGGTISFIQGFFVYSGAVTIENTSIVSMTARGGDVTGGGGGGAGLGGGLFVASGGSATLINVSFSSDVAAGGSSTNVGGYGGGGLGGAASDDGGGGIGNTSAGLSAEGGEGGTNNSAVALASGLTGIVIGAGSGGSGTTLSGGVSSGGVGGSAGGGGGGAIVAGSTFSTVSAQAGGGGGVGGGNASVVGGGTIVVRGGSGGFGGGGGAAVDKQAGGSAYGGSGGFGGGGGGASGGASAYGGAGGFGGGGGGGTTSGGSGGFGAGNGGSGGTSPGGEGGGGLGAGADVFVQQGGSVVIIGGTLSAVRLSTVTVTVSGSAVTSTVSGDVSGGTGANAGSAFGSTIFLQGSQTLSLVASSGQTTVVSGGIADEYGSKPGQATNQGTVAARTVKGTVQIGDTTGGYTGTVDLAGANTFTGGILFYSGDLELGNTTAGGSGVSLVDAITFESSGLTLIVDSGVIAAGGSLINKVSGLATGDVIDLKGATWAASNTATAVGTTLTVTYSGGHTEAITLGAALGSTYKLAVSSDGSGGTDVTVQSLVVSGATTTNTNDETSVFPLSTVTVVDAYTAATETVTITLNGGGSDANGTLIGATWVSAGTYTIASAIASVVSTALEALVFEPTAHEVSAGSTVSTTLTIAVADTANSEATTNASTIIVATAVNDPPTIAGGTGYTTNDETSVTPFSIITIADIDTSTTDVVTITLSSGDANGTIASGAAWVSAGTYTLSAQTSVVNTALEALVFTPKAHEVTAGNTVTTGFTVVVSQTGGGTTYTATNTAASVVATAVNDAPTIAGSAASPTTDETTTFKPFATITIADVDVSTTDTVKITLSGGDANGTIASGATWVSAGTYTLTGLTSVVITALEALVFTPTAHEVSAGSIVTTAATIVVSQTGGGSTNTATSTAASIVATAVNDAPTIAGGKGYTTNDETTVKPFSTITIADVDTSTTDVVTITLSSGDANGTIASGATWVAAGTYTLSGQTSVVNTALEALVFTPKAHQVTPGGTVTTGLTVVVSQTAGGSTNTATNTAASVVATAVNDAPTLAGTGGSATNDETTVKPFSTITLADVDVSATDVVTITLSSGDANGTIASGATRVSAGTYTLSGLTSVVNTALEALVFTPTAHQVSAGSTVTTGITIVASQTAGGSTMSATNTAASVVATAVNDAPTLSGTGGSTTNDETTVKPFATITLADVDISTTDIVTITFSSGDANGTIASGATWVSAGTYTLSGLTSVVNTALEALVFTPTAHEVRAGSTVTTSITLVASQTAGGSTVSATNTAASVVATAVNDAPTLAGTGGSTTNDETTVKPFATITLADVDISTTDIVTITLSSGDANGTIASGVTWVSAGTYTLSGLTSVVATALEALVFTPKEHQVTPGSTVTTGFTVVASQTAGGSTVSATSTAASVVATAVNDAPTLAGTGGSTTNDETTVKPFTTITLADVDVSTTDIITITLSSGDANGTIASGATWVSAGTYTLSGLTSVVNTALEALVFTPTAHEVCAGSIVTTSITLVASQTGGGSTVSATNTAASVVATAVNDAPTIAGGSTSTTTDETTTLKPFSTITLADVDTSTTDTVTITLSSGDANGTITSGATWVSAGTYTLTGLTSVVATALEALVFTPKAHEVTAGSTVTMSATIVVSQTGGGSTNTATNTAASVVATAVNDGPTISGTGGSTNNDETTVKPFSTITIADVDTSTTDTVTITLSSGDANGTIASGATWVSAGIYTLAGLTSVVATALEALVFTPKAHEVTAGNTVTTGLTVVASQSGGGSTVSATSTAASVVATAVNDPPTLAGGSAATITDETTVAPFATLTLADVDVSTTETVTIILGSGDSNGTLSSGASYISAGTYTLSGLTSVINTTLEALVFTPTAHQVTPLGTVTTAFTITASQTGGGSTVNATNTAASVVATAVNDAPTLSGAASWAITDGTTTLQPFATVTIADPDYSTTQTVTITLSSGDANGTISSGATWVSAGTYTLQGAATAVTSALEALVFTPTSGEVSAGSTVTTTFTLIDSQTANGSTVSATNTATTVVATAVNHAMTITGAATAVTTDETTTLKPLATVTLSDATSNASDSVTLTLSSGDSDGTLTDSAVWISAGTYTLAGTASSITTALEALVFKPTAHQVSAGSTVTTVLTLAAVNTTAGTSASNNSDTVIVTAVNDAPTIAGGSTSTTTDETTTLKPFSTITIADVDTSTTDTVTITLSSGDANGTITSGATWVSAGTYTLSGLTSVVATALEVLVFTPTPHEVTAGSTVTTTATIVASQTGGGSTVSATNTAVSVVASAVNDAPTIAGGSTSTTTDETTTLKPFSTITIADVDTSTTDNVTITLSSGDANGTITSGATWVSAGTYTLTGLTSVVATALEALVFTPKAHEVTAGSTVTMSATIVVSQTGGGSTNTATNTAASVVATAVNDGPTISGTGGSTNNDETTVKPFSTITIADVDTSTTDTVTITLSSGDANGTIASGATWVSAGIYTLAGLTSVVATALEALVFTPKAHEVTAGNTVTTGLTVVASQSGGGSTVSATSTAASVVATAVNDPPTLAGGSAATITDETTVAPFATLTLADVDVSTTETVTIILGSGDSNGTLSSGASYISAGTYTLSGLTSVINTTLEALVFTPTAHQVTPLGTVTTAFTITASQTGGGSTVNATNTAASVVATAVNDAPTLSGAASWAITDGTTTLQPFATVTIADPDYSTTQTVTITLSSGDANGTISSGATWVSAGTYTLQGAATAVTSALEALVFTPTSGEVSAGSTVTTTFTLIDSQTANGSTVSATNTATTVVATAVNHAMTITGAATSVTTDETTTLKPLATVTLSDATSNASDTVTITLSSGDSDGTLTGSAVWISAGTYTLAGTASSITTALEALVFKPTAHQVSAGSTVTTVLTLAAVNTTAGTSASNNSDTVIVTAVNDAPTIAGGSGSTTNDESTVQPFSLITLADIDTSTTDVATLTLSNGDANGTIAAGATWVSAGTYTLAGLTSVVVTALEALVFTPIAHQVAAGSTVTTGVTIVVSQTGGGSTNTATNTAASVVATAVNDAPTISGTGGLTTNDETSVTPFSLITIADVDASTTDTVKITLSGGDANGTIASGATWVSAGTYTLSGLTSVVATALQALVFTPTAHEVAAGRTVTTSATIVVSQTGGGSTNTATNTAASVVATAVNDAPTLAGGAASTGNDETTLTPFSTVTLADVDISATDIVTITLSGGDTNGTIASGATWVSAGTYTLSGLTSVVATALEALVFTPTEHEVSAGSTVTTAITVVASQTGGGSTVIATYTATSIVATAVNDAPTIAGGSASTTDDETTVKPFSTVTLADVDTSTTDTVTIKLSSGDANGTIASGATWVSTGTYTLTGLTSVVATALEALVFTPTAHQVTAGSTVTTGITLVASQTAGGSTNTATSTAVAVVATAVNDAPTIAGTGGSTTDDETTVKPFSTITLADVDVSTRDVVTITLSSGDVNGTIASGATWVSAGTYTLAGLTSVVATALEALVFTPTARQVNAGSTVTTRFTLVASQTAGGSTVAATNTAVSIIATALNDAPTIGGAGTVVINSTATVRPFASVTIADVGASTSEIVSITLSGGDANGTLSGAVYMSAGTYSLTGTPSSVTTALEAVVFTPTSQPVTVGNAVTTTLTLAVSQTSGGSTNSPSEVVSVQVIAVSSTVTSTTTSGGAGSTISNSGTVAPAVNTTTNTTQTTATTVLPLTISGALAGQTVVNTGTIAPFAGVTISDPNGIGQTETLTVTASKALAGAFLASTTSSANITVTGGLGSETIIGAASAASAALQGLRFIPQASFNNTVATGFTIAVRDTASATAFDTTSTVIATPATTTSRTATTTDTTSGATTNTTTDIITGNDHQTLTLFPSTARITSTSDTILTAHATLSSANGKLTDTLGTVSADGLSFTVVGDAAEVAAALSALTFAPFENTGEPARPSPPELRLISVTVAAWLRTWRMSLLLPAKHRFPTCPSRSPMPLRSRQWKSHSPVIWPAHFPISASAR
jgi:plastocyanin